MPVKKVKGRYRVPMRLYVKKKNGKVVSYLTSKKCKLLDILSGENGIRFRIKVMYGGENTNQSVWYKTKKELKFAYRAFTEIDLLKEFA